MPGAFCISFSWLAVAFLIAQNTPALETLFFLLLAFTITALFAFTGFAAICAALLNFSFVFCFCFFTAGQL